MFSLEELVRASWKIFRVHGALAEVALKATGKREFELAEAQEIVAKFALRQIKK